MNLSSEIFSSQSRTWVLGSSRSAAPMWSWIILGAGITALLAAGIMTWSFWQDPAPAPVKRVTLNLYSDYDPQTPGGYRMVVSPSGQDLVYLGLDKGVGRIYHRRLDQTETRALVLCNIEYFG